MKLLAFFTISLAFGFSVNVVLSNSSVERNKADNNLDIVACSICSWSVVPFPKSDAHNMTCFYIKFNENHLLNYANAALCETEKIKLHNMMGRGDIFVRYPDYDY